MRRQPPPTARVPFSGGRLHAVRDRLRGRANASARFSRPWSSSRASSPCCARSPTRRASPSRRSPSACRSRPAAWSHSSTRWNSAHCIERRHNPEDRRTRALHLTKKGRALLERAFTLAAGFELDLCAELTGAERDQLLDLLPRVGAQLGLPDGVPAAHPAHAALGDAEPACGDMAGAGFEPAKAEPTRLQRVPFDRSGTPPGAVSLGRCCAEARAQGGARVRRPRAAAARRAASAASSACGSRSGGRARG